MLNTIVAKVLKGFYDKLVDAKDFSKAVTALVGETYKNHKRIVFNGNSYSNEWAEEAERRGLLNLRSCPDALDTFIAPKNIALFKEFGIFNSVEIHSRYEILNEEYAKTVHIEALTLIDMINRQVLPASEGYATKLADGICSKKAACPHLRFDAEIGQLEKISVLTDELYEADNELQLATEEAEAYEGSALAHYYREKVLPLMEKVRKPADELELVVDQSVWPYPTYGEMLFYI